MVLVLPFKWLGYFCILGTLILIFNFASSKNLSEIPFIVAIGSIGLVWTYYVNWKKIEWKKEPKLIGFVLIIAGLTGIYATFLQGALGIMDYGILLLLSLMAILGIFLILKRQK